MASKLSSAFDELLAQNRKQMDELLGKSPEAAPGPAAQSPTYAPAPPSPPRATAGPVTTTSKPVSTSGRPSSRRDDVPPEVAAQLDRRYGDEWRHEVKERRREGNEIVLTCSLMVEADNLSTTQTGRAPVGAGTGFINGSANGFRFRLTPKGGGQGESGNDPEGVAYRKALGKALTRCIETLS